MVSFVCSHLGCVMVAAAGGGAALRAPAGSLGCAAPQCACVYVPIRVCLVRASIGCSTDSAAALSTAGHQSGRQTEVLVSRQNQALLLMLLKYLAAGGQSNRVREGQLADILCSRS